MAVDETPSKNPVAPTTGAGPHRWTKGQSGNPAGTKSKKGDAIRRFAREALLDNPEWRQSAIERIVSGKAPHLETYLLQMDFGKPKEVVEHKGGNPFSELMARALGKPATPESEDEPDGPA